MPQIDLISSEQLERRDPKECLLLLDLRVRDEYRCGHLKGSVNLEKRHMRLILDNVDKQVPILAYCQDGKESQVLAECFAEMGFKSIKVLEGGFEAWLNWKQRHSSIRSQLHAWMQEHAFSVEEINRRGFNGETALMSAARQGRTEFVVELLSFGAEINALNNDGNSALWLACFADSQPIVDILIGLGANLDNQNDNGATPLIYSASAGREMMVASLLNAGARTDLETLDGFSARDVAATRNILSALKAPQASDIASAGCYAHIN